MSEEPLALCLLADGTASMGSALSAIKESFVVIRATAIICKVKIYCAVYRDYDTYSGKGHENGGVFISNELETASDFDIGYTHMYVYVYMYICICIYICI